MSMYEEIARQSGLMHITGYTVINYGGKAVYVEGVNKLLFVGAENVKLSVGKKYIEIDGEELVIDQMETGALIVKGHIFSITERGNV